jgi:hypothetical protein
MKILNLRIGPATNSSSSHSIVIFKDNPKSFNDRPIINNYELSRDFGWDNFELWSSREKFIYFVIQVYTNLNFIETKEEKLVILNQLFGIQDIDVIGHIDHQSVWHLPSKFIMNKKFMDDLGKFICRDDVVIFGGNDNSHDTPTENYTGHITTHDICDIIYRGGGEISQTSENVWTFYNRWSGAKIRFAVDDNVEVTHSATPELVDISLGDY